MLSHLMIGANDLERAGGFYDIVLAPLGAKRTFVSPTRIGYSNGSGPSVLLCPPADGKPTVPPNGMMPSFAAPSREAVDEFYRLALANGGKDEGAPGRRGDMEPPLYLAYVRDLDGNKLAALYRG
jgi:catechol 2,3-dioxygenase-like lactoylglutathione lyase family enzyme